MRLSVFVAALLTSASAVNAQPAVTHAATATAVSPNLPPFAYPATKRVAVVDSEFGVEVADPYRWLENDVRNDPDVAAENQVTDKFLETPATSPCATGSRRG